LWCAPRGHRRRGGCRVCASSAASESRRDDRDAVASVASVRDGEARVLAPSLEPADAFASSLWPVSRVRVIARPVCSHLPSSLPVAFADASSPSARRECSATVLRDVARLQAMASTSSRAEAGPMAPTCPPAVAQAAAAPRTHARSIGHARSSGAGCATCATLRSSGSALRIGAQPRPEFRGGTGAVWEVLRGARASRATRRDHDDQSARMRGRGPRRRSPPRISR
jgi:hypothetical protein